jgi:hypothetical protein
VVGRASEHAENWNVPSRNPKADDFGGREATFSATTNFIKKKASK